jgi:hypothetical protein
MSEEISSPVQTSSGPPRSFYVISGLALAWNLVGVAIYIMQVTMTEEALAAMEPARRALMESTPTWLTGVYALAVNAGALGCLLLILRKAWAVPILVVSLLCIVVQMGYSLTMTEAMEVLGGAVVAQSALITAVGIYLVWYSRRAKDNGWIS